MSFKLGRVKVLQILGQCLDATENLILFAKLNQNSKRENTLLPCQFIFYEKQGFFLLLKVSLS